MPRFSDLQMAINHIAGYVFVVNGSHFLNITDTYLHYKVIMKRLHVCLMGGSPGDISENPVKLEKRKKGWRMSCDVGEATEELENEL